MDRLQIIIGIIEIIADPNAILEYCLLTLLVIALLFVYYLLIWINSLHLCFLFSFCLFLVF